MITEGYMIVESIKDVGIEKCISYIEKKRPEFDFNTCLVSELNTQSVETINGVQ